jgi:hypothetical protein
VRREWPRLSRRWPFGPGEGNRGGAAAEGGIGRWGVAGRGDAEIGVPGGGGKEKAPQVRKTHLARSIFEPVFPSDKKRWPPQREAAISSERCWSQKLRADSGGITKQQRADGTVGYIGGHTVDQVDSEIPS